MASIDNDLKMRWGRDGLANLLAWLAENLSQFDIGEQVELKRAIHEAVAVVIRKHEADNMVSANLALGCHLENIQRLEKQVDDYRHVLKNRGWLTK